MKSLKEVKEHIAEILDCPEYSRAIDVRGAEYLNMAKHLSNYGYNKNNNTLIKRQSQFLDHRDILFAEYNKLIDATRTKLKGEKLANTISKIESSKFGKKNVKLREKLEKRCKEDGLDVDIVITNIDLVAYYLKGIGKKHADDTNYSVDDSGSLRPNTIKDLRVFGNQDTAEQILKAIRELGCRNNDSVIYEPIGDELDSKKTKAFITNTTKIDKEKHGRIGYDCVCGQDGLVHIFICKYENQYFVLGSTCIIHLPELMRDSAMKLELSEIELETRIKKITDRYNMSEGETVLKKLKENISEIKLLDESLRYTQTKLSELLKKKRSEERERERRRVHRDNRIKKKKQLQQLEKKRQESLTNKLTSRENLELYAKQREERMMLKQNRYKKKI